MAYSNDAFIACDRVWTPIDPRPIQLTYPEPCYQPTQDELDRIEIGDRILVWSKTYPHRPEFERTWLAITGIDGDTLSGTPNEVTFPCPLPAGTEVRFPRNYAVSILPAEECVANHPQDDPELIADLLTRRWSDTEDAMRLLKRSITAPPQN